MNAHQIEALFKRHVRAAGVCGGGAFRLEPEILLVDEGLAWKQKRLMLNK